MSNYKDGHCLKDYFCIDCGKKLVKIKAKYCKKHYSKHRTIEWNKKISSSLKGHIPWNKGLTKFDSPKIMCHSKRMKLNNPIYKINQKRENNFNWRGGLSYEKYSFDWTKLLREKVRKRDRNRCQLCKKKFKRKLSIHHINYNKSNNNHLNLIGLCVKCHADTGNDRDFWRLYFLFLINKKREIFRRFYETV